MSFRKLTIIFAGVALACGISAAPALGDAYGFEPFGVGGELDHSIQGENGYIESEGAGFTSPFADVCNWRVDYAHYDATGSGGAYRRFTGPTTYGCNRNAEARGVVWNASAEPGTACAILYTNGVEKARQCHNIF